MFISVLRGCFDRLATRGSAGRTSVAPARRVGPAAIRYGGAAAIWIVAAGAWAQLPAPAAGAAPVGTGAPAPAVSVPVGPDARTGTTTSDYIIGPGDVIQIYVWRSPELSVTVPVRPDGKISTPLVEDVVAVGKKPSELAREMESILSAYVRAPQVNIIVATAQSAFSQVMVVGQVARPQSIGYKEGMRVLDLILAVGGVTEYGAPNRARLVRKGPDGKDIQIKVHLRDLLQKGKMSENVKVQPGDVLIVPEALF